MDMETMLALMAAPIYTNNIVHNIRKHTTAELMAQAVKEAELLWLAVVNRKKAA